VKVSSSWRKYQLAAESYGGGVAESVESQLERL
jgi:hypothetical protein